MRGFSTELRRRSPETPIVLADLHQSGQHVVDAPSQQILSAFPEVDLLLRHEAEAILKSEVEKLLSSGRPSIPRAEQGSEVEDLSSLPLPAWDRVDVQAYFRLHESITRGLGRPKWAFPIASRSLPFLSSRGCPFRCAHCSSNPGRAPGSPKTQRRYPGEYLAKHLDFLVALGARRVHVLDELANVNERHFDSLLELITERNLQLELPNGLRADYVIDRHLALMRGHITTLSVSAESGVPRVVSEVVGKELDLSCIESVAERAQASEVSLLVHYMIGLPGETREEMNRTLAFALDLERRFGAEPSVQFATPLPGTRLASMAKSLPVVEDWGPRFQKIPTQLGESASEADLRVMKDSFDARRALSRSPKTVVLSPTYQCNNRCSFCVTGTRAQIHGAGHGELLAEHRARGATRLELDGGEPTLHPDLFRLISEARRLGYEQIVLRTNGRRAAYAEYAERIAHSGLTHVQFGIQGAEAETHNRDVGDADAFEQTLAGVRNVMKFAVRGIDLGASVTLTRQSVETLDAIVSLCHEIGLTNVDLGFLLPFGNEATGTEATARVVMGILESWRKIICLRVLNLPPCFLPGYEEHVAPDFLELPDRFVFANFEGVDLYDHLRRSREHGAECGGCPRRVGCGGFYRLGAEPRWLSNELERTGMKRHGAVTQSR